MQKQKIKEKNKKGQIEAILSYHAVNCRTIPKQKLTKTIPEQDSMETAWKAMAF